MSSCFGSSEGGYSTKITIEDKLWPQSSRDDESKHSQVTFTLDGKPFTATRNGTIFSVQGPGRDPLPM
ncbi:uncharacterized protein I303_103957 [Kwoniella dejecticola CBS 10117]|uniref:Uncharacterized protein n=1 Tax=Kwoniella dejecticola CBS 10117 TaxID=1296121 RepID=A0A1A6A863_9TREE|nr:uncharacterized protein I303_03975 [Kwoniella dejecticola CBS 10117]OBR86254.1 hypothetical protein I303_03975 [Kwoniella dejecticola CBS 10117]